MSARPVFVYGSLMVDEVLRALLRRDVEPLAGTVDGWARRSLDGLSYPAVIPQAGASTRGLVVAGLTVFERALFDTFEGDQYDIVAVEVSTASGLVDADLYAAGPELVELARDEDWDPRQLDEVLAAYVDNCTRFRKAFDELRG